jgi:hypothetical protein
MRDRINNKVDLLRKALWSCNFQLSTSEMGQLECNFSQMWAISGFNVKIEDQTTHKLYGFSSNILELS